MQTPGASGIETFKVVASGAKTLEDPPGVTQKGFARGRERDRSRTGPAIDEALPDNSFESSELLGHGALSVAEILRRTADRPSSSDGVEGSKVTNIKVPKFSDCGHDPHSIYSLA